jgi:DNA-binding LacI/PurR family transcriptional regulator
MEEQKAKPTIEDVAKHCGVSVATVSRVVNKSNPVSKELHKKVKKAIKELGFTPRQWTGRVKTETIALAIPDILNPLYAQILHGSQEEADRHDINLVFMNLAPNQRRQKQYLSILSQGAFKGLIVVGSRLHSEDLQEIYEQEHLPVVMAIRSTEIEDFPCIMFDYETPTFQATNYLLSLNHTRIAYLSGPPDWTSSQARKEGIQRALKNAGLTLPEKFYRWSYPNIENGVQAANSLLNLPASERPTAIIAFNDLMAIGAMHAIRLAGLTVPRDISVIGFDDISMAAYTNPPLTTIAQPAYRMGQLAVQTIFELIEGDPKIQGGFTLLECPLILRESTAPCRG